MKTPYFYVIKHTPSQRYYAGCKINSLADSTNLMTECGYKTSSKIIKGIIQTDGLESFEVVKIKHFSSPVDALTYETSFLKKVNAAENPKFINLNNGGKNFVNKGGYKLKESTKNKMKKPKSKETIEKQKQSLKLRNKDSWAKAMETRKNNGLPWISDEQRDKIKKFNKEYWGDKNKEKQRIRMQEYYKINPVSEETKMKISRASSGANNGMFGKTQSVSTREKMKQAWERRKLNKKNQSFGEDDLF